MSAQAEARGLRPERGIPLGATAMSRASRGSRASPHENRKSPVFTCKHDTLGSFYFRAAHCLRGDHLFFCRNLGTSMLLVSTLLFQVGTLVSMLL